MKYTENLKKRIIVVAVAIASYIFVPILIGLLMFSFFHPTHFPVAGYVVHAIQIFVFVILIYGALAWIKPSFIPRYVSRKIVTGIICTIVILTVLPSGISSSLEPVGSCTITNNSQGVKSVSNNGHSTEQECIDSCIHTENENTQYNQKSCEFVSVETSWSKTPEDLKGYKPNI